MATVDRRSPFLKVHARNGYLYLLSGWTVQESARTITGDGEHIDSARQTISRGRFTISLEDVALLETNVVHRSSAVAGLAIVTGVSAAVTAYCIAQPKACFGSCPTFYIGDQRDAPIQAEGFSTSVAPSLEARDVDALYRTEFRRGGRLNVTMKNEALETHVVKSVRLLAAARPPHGRVLATVGGQFREASDPRQARECRDHSVDCVSRVRAFDGIERLSVTDPDDLARRETIEVRLVLEEGPQALVMASRQSLASTYLFYQSLAYLGRAAGATLAALERGDRTVATGFARLQQVLGGIEVWSETQHGAWVRVGDIHELGPLASDVVALPLPPETTGRLRLRMARGHWRIDYLASVTLGAEVRPAILAPWAVRDGTGALIRDGSLTTLPGDTYTYSFNVPRGAHQELFLETQATTWNGCGSSGWLRKIRGERISSSPIPSNCCATSRLSSNLTSRIWNPSSGAAAMPGHRQTVTLCLVAALLSGCARNPAPQTWRFSAREAQQSVRGAWIVVELREASSDPAQRRVEGELIAVDAAAVHVLSMSGYRPVPRPLIGRVTVGGVFHSRGLLALWASIGAASTLSHGALLVTTVPMWTLAGVLASAHESRAGIIKDLDAARAFARFPQGLPENFDPAALDSPVSGRD
ncbi:MAG TPA: hypothetical protein VJ820_09435 [Propionibacteriaceae bacterium]|nr:hypothetical protein [Propionibacteriaceae bacterium]